MDALIYKDTIYGGGGAMRGNYFNPIIYSTEERVVGVWIDNKPLYQKTCVYGSVSGTAASLSLDIANVEYISLCTEGSSVNGNCPISYVTGSNYNNNIGGFFDVSANDAAFAIRIGSAMAGYVDSVVLTVVYTKTTDVAGSGKYNTLGVPNVHYTTDEQVIGTWIDGKPVYQKTFSATLSGDSASIDISNLNMERVIALEGSYDIGVTQLALNEYIASSVLTYTHINTGLNPPYIDCKNYVSNNSTVYITVKYTKTTD